MLQPNLLGVGVGVEGEADDEEEGVVPHPTVREAGEPSSLLVQRSLKSDDDDDE